MGFRKTICVLLVMLFVLSGCSQTDQSVLTRALDDIKASLTLMDTRFSIYENALLTILEYTENPNDEALDAAITACEGAIEEITSLTVPESSLTAEERAELVRLGMNMADYDIPFQYAEYHKEENIINLTDILYYLSNAPLLDDMLEYIVGFHVRFQSLNRKVAYAGMNTLFCHLNDPEIELFKTNFLSGLTSLSSDNLPWETELAVLEARIDFWLKEMEAEVDAYAEFIGALYSDSLTGP